ncbi:hypothetical protein GK047_07415 [Paenibacillus sp. SYP-B3998]|uniref:Uncharacterized protein n=1 Tax=Paenibacillus sp. SYP-B3998 TaxID=2678564 RepID=A0A6G3ZVW3_9BACL|nr:hypothetical protein [Paenibacillus sp. SYP-B3998]NEW05844.1 hypothetical protein [Paenibacillus sp. SYP-B3998]
MKYLFKDLFLITAKVNLLFICLFGLTYFLAAITYNMIFSVPYDQSKVISPLYYGLLFSTIPYFTIGYWTAKESKQSTAIKLFTLIYMMLLDKLLIVYVLGIFTNFLPAQENGFFSTAYSYMCEELPFYCHPLAYYTIGTAVAVLAFFIGIGLYNKRKTTVFLVTQEEQN